MHNSRTFRNFCIVSIFDDFFFLRIFVNMLRILLFLTFIFTAGVVFSQSPSLNQIDKDGKKQGHWVKKDQHERTIYEGVFKDDTPTGEFKYYYDDGELKTSSVFSKSGTVCKTKHFFPGHILMAEGNYVNEKRDSIWKFYNAPNILVSEESFKNGKKTGWRKILTRMEKCLRKEIGKTVYCMVHGKNIIKTELFSRKEFTL